GDSSGSVKRRDTIPVLRTIAAGLRGGLTRCATSVVETANPGSIVPVPAMRAGRMVRAVIVVESLAQLAPHVLQFADLTLDLFLFAQGRGGYAARVHEQHRLQGRNARRGKLDERVGLLAEDAAGQVPLERAPGLEVDHPVPWRQAAQCAAQRIAEDAGWV